ncbi:ABC transporter transmembrane domain-containing protein [Aliisedimentitalea scapharcae]|uniref:ABC transporter transmembrane domain-containing protein n=1 Tax=Aliisedimentitalea scapharcae TaxID=1524259 RepID=A0ABZ2XS90_9RHOB|nr:cyclic nucleotide-binding domain-containing protein [Rhodobacteraceae bacterium M382]
MEPTLFSFIWKYSKRQQLVLLGLTILTFPFIYATLELPKRIINDAIGMQAASYDVLGFELGQTQYLMLLCVAFLGAVLAAGMLKMRLNTMKGVLAERMLRRLRYSLIARMMRFPKPYFQKTSQGELVSMITSEAEPMGGLMGDAVAQPVFQAGQMLTIVTFLFMQSVWFGLASVMLIPLQAWVIPRLQRQINLLNKERIQEVRHLASEIGESAAGISDLRSNGGWRFRLALISDRLGRLFDIRFKIYRKKFFMKFLNNLITQLTPFLFYSVGGYLVIKGEITVGALVAALGAYKDLSAPWKELLTFYNQIQDMSLRWTVVTERFAPRNMVPEKLFQGEPDSIPHLTGSVVLDDVTVRDADGNTILEDISLKIPPGARVAIKSPVPAERAAFAQLLTREVVPSHGTVTLSGHKLNDLHQAVIAARVGYAHSRPYLFDGTLGDNLMMSLKTHPHTGLPLTREEERRLNEAKRSGNSEYLLDSDWINPDLAELSDRESICDWWFQLVQAMGIDEQHFRRTLLSRLDEAKHRDLVREIIALRPVVHEKLKQAGLDDLVFRFDPEQFNPAVPLGGNLLFASPTREISQEALAMETGFYELMQELGMAREGMEISLGVMETLQHTFGQEDTDHPLFRRLGLEPEMYRRLSDIVNRRKEVGESKLSRDDRALLMTVPFLLTAEQIGAAFPEEYKQKILDIRASSGPRILASTGDMFRRVAPDTYVPRLTVLENLLYGRISLRAGARAQMIEDIAAEVLNAHGLRQPIAAVLFDLKTGLGGSNLPTVFQERAAFSRAGIKRPDILVMDTVLASHDAESRLQTRHQLRELLPRSIMIFLEEQFAHPERYDLFVEIKNGRVDGVKRTQQAMGADTATADLQRKIAAITSNDLFARLDERNQRLLAFSGQWVNVSAGHRLFRANEVADSAYLCVSGAAELRWPGSRPDDPALTVIEPGRLIGDLTILTGGVRRMDLTSTTESCFLRLGAEEFRAVIENDANVAVAMLETVAGHLETVGRALESMDIDLASVIRKGWDIKTEDAQDSVSGQDVGT